MTTIFAFQKSITMKIIRCVCSLDNLDLLGLANILVIISSYIDDYYMLPWNQNC